MVSIVFYGAIMSNHSEKITLSVALVTRNRPELLSQCLESLRSQSIQPFEVIVSDDSDLEIAPEIEAIAKGWNCQYITGPRRGLQANLNNAVDACHGTHVRIVNDDHTFPENHFKIIQNLLESDPNSIWTLGEYCEIPGTQSLFQLPGEIQPRGFHKPIENFDDCMGISGGASIYPRKIFEYHHFLEAFGYVCDLEFGPRLKALGYRIRYCSETHVIHQTPIIIRDPKMLCKGHFLLSYLTYAFYLPNFLKKSECLIYFWWIAFLGSINIRKAGFTFVDYQKTRELGQKYGKLFQTGKYNQIF